MIVLNTGTQTERLTWTDPCVGQSHTPQRGRGRKQERRWCDNGGGGEETLRGHARGYRDDGQGWRVLDREVGEAGEWRSGIV